MASSNPTSISGNLWATRRQALDPQMELSVTSAQQSDRSMLQSLVVAKVQGLKQHLSQMEEALQKRQGGFSNNASYNVAQKWLQGIIVACGNQPVAERRSEAESTESAEHVESVAPFRL